jgi:hypothetical protein
VDRTTRQVIKETVKVMTETPRDAGNDTVEVSGEEAVAETKSAKVDRKKEAKKGKGKAQSRLDALERMFVSSKNESADEIEEDED